MPESRLTTSAKAVIIEGGRLLTLVKRRGEHTYHVLPGGTQEPGESLAQAVVREVEEEVGARAEVLELLHVRDYVADHHEFAAQSAGLHDVELYFRCRLTEPVGARPQSHPDKRQIGVEWVELSRLAEADLYPRVLVPILTGRRKDAPVYLGDVN
jgi:8-oxo-dGTP diphosphatase